MPFKHQLLFTNYLISGYSRAEREAAAKDCLPTVYLKHRSVQTLKEEVYGLMPAQCRKVKEVGDLNLLSELTTEAPVNGSSNYNCSTVAKYLVG